MSGKRSYGTFSSTAAGSTWDHFDPDTSFYGGEDDSSGGVPPRSSYLASVSPKYTKVDRGHVTVGDDDPNQVELSRGTGKRPAPCPSVVVPFSETTTSTATTATATASASSSTSSSSSSLDATEVVEPCRRRHMSIYHAIPARYIPSTSDRIDLEITSEIHEAARWSGGIYTEDVHDEVSSIVWPMTKMVPPNRRYHTLTWLNMSGDVRGANFGIRVMPSRKEEWTTKKLAAMRILESRRRTTAKKSVATESKSSSSSGSGTKKRGAGEKEGRTEAEPVANVHSMADGQVYVPLTQEAQMAILEWMSSDEQARRDELKRLQRRRDHRVAFGGGRGMWTPSTPGGEDVEQPTSDFFGDDTAGMGTAAASTGEGESRIQGYWVYLGLRFKPGEVYAFIADFELEAPSIITEDGFEAIASGYQNALRGCFTGETLNRLDVGVSTPYYTIVRREEKDSTTGRAVYRQLIKNAAHFIFAFVPTEVMQHCMGLMLFDGVLRDLWGDDHPFQSRKSIRDINDKTILGNGLRFNFAGKAIPCPYQSKDDVNFCKLRDCARCGGEGKLHVDRRYELRMWLNSDGTRNHDIVRRAQSDLLFQLQITSPFMIEGVEVRPGMYRRNRPAPDWKSPFPEDMVRLVEDVGGASGKIDWKHLNAIPLGKEWEWVRPESKDDTSNASGSGSGVVGGGGGSGGVGVVGSGGSPPVDSRTRYTHLATGATGKPFALVENVPRYRVTGGGTRGGKSGGSGGGGDSGMTPVDLRFEGRRLVQETLRRFLRDPDRGTKPCLGRVWRMGSRRASRSMAAPGGGAGGGGTGTSGSSTGLLQAHVVLEIHREFRYCLNKKACHNSQSIYAVCRYRRGTVSSGGPYLEWYQKCHSEHSYGGGPVCRDWSSEVLATTRDPGLVRILFPDLAASSPDPAGMVVSAASPLFMLTPSGSSATSRASHATTTGSTGSASAISPPPTSLIVRPSGSLALVTRPASTTPSPRSTTPVPTTVSSPVSAASGTSSTFRTPSPRTFLSPSPLSHLTIEHVLGTAAGAVSGSRRTPSPSARTAGWSFASPRSPSPGATVTTMSSGAISGRGVVGEGMVGSGSGHGGDGGHGSGRGIGASGGANRSSPSSNIMYSTTPRVTATSSPRPMASPVSSVSAVTSTTRLMTMATGSSVTGGGPAMGAVGTGMGVGMGVGGLAARMAAMGAVPALHCRRATDPKTITSPSTSASAARPATPHSPALVMRSVALGKR